MPIYRGEHPHSTKESKVPEICVSRGGLSIPGVTLWNFSSPIRIHLGGLPAKPIWPTICNMATSVPRRLAQQPAIFPSHTRSHIVVQLTSHWDDLSTRKSLPWSQRSNSRPTPGFHVPSTRPISSPVCPLVHWLSLNVQNRSNPQEMMVMPPSLLPHLVWWQNEEVVRQGVPLGVNSPVWELTTDSSETHWGAQLAPLDQQPSLDTRRVNEP
jgi:hypothetical protein